MNKIVAIDIQPTSRCNLRCNGCWGAPRNPKDSTLSLQQFRWIIKVLLHKMPFNAVVFDGGEPLILNDIEKFFKISYENGFTNILSTNGMLIKERINSLKYLSAIGFPLDGPDGQINAMFRMPYGANHFKKSIEAIKIVNRIYPNMVVKLGTVVMQKNKSYINKIGILILKEKLHINTWKLYQFLPCFGQNKHQLYKEKNDTLPDNEFRRLYKHLVKMYPGMHIVPNYNPRNYGNLLIGPDGALTTEMDSDGRVEPFLGNVFSDPINKTRQSMYNVMRSEMMENRIVETYVSSER